MRTFIATPEEFATGAAATKATELYRNRNRKPRPPQVRVPAPELDRQIGAVSPEDFAAGRPFWGKRVRGHRTEPVPTLKPFPETTVKARALVSALLEQRDDLSTLPLPPEAKRYARMKSDILFRKGGQAKPQLYVDAAAALSNQRGKKKGFKNYDGAAYSPKHECQCQACGHAFDYGAVPESSMGAVSCPGCGRTLDQEGHLLEGAKEFLKKHGLVRSREIKVERDPNHEAFLAIPILERPGERWTNLFRIPEQGAETAFKKRLEILVRGRRGYQPGDIFVSVLGKYLVTDDLTIKRL